MNDVVYGDKRIYWVWLTMVFGAGNADLWRLCRGYESIHDFSQAVRNGSVGGLSSGVMKRAAAIPFDRAKELIESCESKGIGVIYFRDPVYPRRLKKTVNPPPVLFVRGDIRKLDAAAVIAVVGTRHPSDYSLSVTQHICAQLARMGAVVVTGYEPGIDCAANEAAVKSGAVSAAVCGRGILNELSGGELADDIARNGSVIAEYTDSEDYGKVRFSHRNRILCGLADGVLFVENSDSSSGLNNANHARAQHKPIFAIPPADITDRRYFGQRDLIRKGGIPVFDANDILRALKRSGAAADVREIRTSGDKLPEAEKPRKKNKVSAKKLKSIEKPKKENKASAEKKIIDLSGLPEGEGAICAALAEFGTLHIDQLAEKLDRPAHLIMNGLISLQIKGIIEELPGKQYKLEQ